MYIRTLKKKIKKMTKQIYGRTWMEQESEHPNWTEEAAHPHSSCAPLPYHNEHLGTRPPTGSQRCYWLCV